MSKSHHQRYRKQRREIPERSKIQMTTEEFAALISELGYQYTPDISYDDWISGRRSFDLTEEPA